MGVTADWISIPRPTWFHGGSRDGWFWQPWPADCPFRPEWLSFRLPADGSQGEVLAFGELLVHAITFNQDADWGDPKSTSVPDWDVFNGMRG